MQIINAIGRNDGNDIQLDVLPLPADLPMFPDVSGDSEVSAMDALQVINQLARLPNSSGGSGELIGEAVFEQPLEPVAAFAAQGFVGGSSMVRIHSRKQLNRLFSSGCFPVRIQKGPPATP